MKLARELSVLVLVLGSAIVGSPAFAGTDPMADPTQVPAGAESPAAGKPLMQTISTSFDVTGASRYLFQGIDYSDGRTVVQPNFTATLGAVSFVGWANYQMDIGDVNEVDLSLKSTRTYGLVTVSPGYTMLRYPNREGWDNSQELFGDVSVEAPLSPTLSIHADFDAGRGVYATFGMTQPIVGTLSAATNVFYQHSYYGMSGIPSVELKMSGSFNYGEWAMTPSLSRFATAENGDFTGEAGIPAGWLFSINVTHAH